MNGCRVGEDRFDVAEVNRQSDRAGALSGAFLAKLNQPLTAEFWQTQPPQLPFKKSEARRLRPANAFADFLEVLSVEANKIAKGLRAVSERTESTGGFPNRLSSDSWFPPREGGGGDGAFR